MDGGCCYGHKNRLNPLISQMSGCREANKIHPLRFVARRAINFLKTSVPIFIVLFEVRAG